MSNAYRLEAPSGVSAAADRALFFAKRSLERHDPRAERRRVEGMRGPRKEEEGARLLVDPARCRMWARHNRRYRRLNETRCADLIQGFKQQGRQEFPAIVRPVRDDPEHDYEVICGARRHWAARHMREHGAPDFGFSIEVRALDDEAAFRLADVENRDRQDITDYERALDYQKALLDYYDGAQRAMAARLEVSEAWLSRYLALADLPREIVAAFGDLALLKERHARALRPLLAKKDCARKILAEANMITLEIAAGKARIEDGAKVVRRLQAAAEPPRPAPIKARAFGERDGAPLIKARKRKGGGLTLDVLRTDDRKALLAAFEDALAALAPKRDAGG